MNAIFNSGIPGCKTQFCFLNITIKNVFKAQSLATTNDIKPTFKSHLKIFGRKLMNKPMHLLELHIAFPVKKVQEFIHKILIFILLVHLDVSI